ncbi:hypothetical protein G6F56_008140 [Rhizopus delemar]|uniref:Uncharacterized protein n=1 Tax=Rhizopus stolonifer TaxID=4846 RepID=A0A367IUL8_RHIST|nr:hypothetical protein G6F56_008140 [Rhizopus delemar]RCH81352.1 hypothetical protein CU098_007522 [Rhizopus stolonifer]
MTQNKQSLIVYGAAAALLAALSTGLAYYVIEDDRKVQRRKTARRAERNASKLLSQISEQRQAIETSIQSIAPVLELECDDKAFKQKEFTLAQSNELLLRLMEQLDAIQPLSLVAGEAVEKPTELEEELADHLKNKKRSVIDAINVLFQRLDECNEKLKKEGIKREEAAKERARIEKEEQERLAREEEERKRIEEEKAQKAREEQERVAQEEALRRQKEEEEQLAREAEQKAREEQEHMVQEEALRRQKEEEQLAKEAEELAQKTAEEERIREAEQVEIERPEEGSGIFVQAEPTTIELNE